MKTALQLYTIREQINADLDGTLRKVADLGLDGIEIHFDLPPPAAQVKSIVDACGLEICAMHVGFYELRDRFEEIANYQHTLENRSVVLPWLPPELRASEQAWKQTIAEIRAIAERCQEADLELSYHNHDFEYLDQVEGMTACQYMFKTVPAPLLEIEMDTYFLVETRQDPAAAIRSFAGALTSPAPQGSPPRTRSVAEHRDWQRNSPLARSVERCACKRDRVAHPRARVLGRATRLGKPP